MHQISLPLYLLLITIKKLLINFFNFNLILNTNASKKIYNSKQEEIYGGRIRKLTYVYPLHLFKYSSIHNKSVCENVNKASSSVARVKVWYAMTRHSVTLTQITMLTIKTLNKIPLLCSKKPHIEISQYFFSPLFISLSLFLSPFSLYFFFLFLIICI